MARAGRPKSVLFACGLNAIRSPMAAALARKLVGGIYVASAGVRRGTTDPFAIAVMDEIGLDLRPHNPHSFEDLEDMNFDLVVTLAPEAHHRALELTRYFAVDVEYWPTLDPSAVVGSRERIIDAYRDVRGQLERRILGRFAPAGEPPERAPDEPDNQAAGEAAPPAHRSPKEP